jgi:hypothetical integral membrane protein (TIGR02206 family)
MKLGSADHLAALAVTLIAAVALVVGARRGGEPWARGARRILALIILAGFAGEQLTYALRGEWTARVNLPFQLTDAVTIAAIAALWRPLPLLVELVYLWALSASLQAVLTPDLNATAPDALYFTYFATHSGAIAAACLLVFGECRALRAGAVARVYAITAAFAAVAAVAAVVASVAVAPRWLVDDGAGLGVDRTRLLAVPALAEDPTQHRPGQHGQQRAQPDDGADLGPFVTRGRDADAAQVPERGRAGVGVDLVGL